MSIQKFLDEHEHLPDTYEIWGAAERPEHPITMADLRHIPVVEIVETMGAPTSCRVTMDGIVRFVGESR